MPGAEPENRRQLPFCGEAEPLLDGACCAYPARSDAARALCCSGPVAGWDPTRSQACCGCPAWRCPTIPFFPLVAGAVSSVRLLLMFPEEDLPGVPMVEPAP